jgi:hypothetical protein
VRVPLAPAPVAQAPAAQAIAAAIAARLTQVHLWPIAAIGAMPAESLQPPI